MKNYNYIKAFFLLQILYIISSLTTVLSKFASQYDFLSGKFILCYAGMLFMLGIYAIGWQQILKKLSLTVAYTSKSVTVVWGLIWGYLLFQEKITLGKILGSVIVICGVVLFTVCDNNDRKKKGAD